MKKILTGLILLTVLVGCDLFSPPEEPDLSFVNFYMLSYLGTDYNFDSDTPGNTYNHPAELYGIWSGKGDVSSYCHSYYSLYFTHTNYEWLQKSRWKDPIPSIQPCRFGVDYNYGDDGFSYRDWKVQGNQLCDKLYDNSFSEWDCESYSITGNTLIWGGTTYTKN